MLRRLIDESAGHFCWPETFENVEKSYFDNIKNLQNPGHSSLNKSSMFSSCDNIGSASANTTITETDYANTTITETYSDNDQHHMDIVLTEI